MTLDSLEALSGPILRGLLLGGLYALIASGLSLIFGVMKLINVAHGDLVVLSSYFAFAVMTVMGVDPFLSLIITIPLWFIMGFALQKYVMSRAFQISTVAPLIIAFGISLIVQNTVQIIWSPMSRGLTTFYTFGNIKLAGVTLPVTYVVNFFAALVVLLALQEFMKRTYVGKAITAASQDRRGAQLVGINTNRVYAYAFGISLISASIAGVLLGLTFPFTPTLGVSFLIIAFGVIIIGGLGSIAGTFIGGMILGVAQTVSGYYLGATAQMLFAYLIVLIVLIIRPQGIFGRRTE
ncbi:MAG: branched-chain amino acid ABC transporter permease [Peptococcaceae bacterium]|nr:branched-chain amino acid ABC transporter permease [Peptococcaceae bacterium]